jgi:radical SAM protein with 4Fe4S-binding SPASM domain
MLGLEEFKSMTNELYPDLMYMLMYFQGEPYLNPNFLEMARHAVKKGVFVATSTNGHYLNEEMARKTVESGIQEVLISIDGATQGTYEQYRVGGQLDKVLQGVRNLVYARAQANSVSPVILLQFLVVGPNEHEIQDIKRLGKSLGVDEVLLKTAQIYNFETGNSLIPQNPQFSRYRKGPDGRYHLKNKLRNQCWKLWMGAEITWDGRVLPCCFDKDAQYVMGRLTDGSFHAIWRSQAYHLFRQNILKSRKEIDICKNCSEGTKVWT